VRFRQPRKSGRGVLSTKKSANKETGRRRRRSTLPCACAGTLYPNGRLR
jgi:hypothetical protein